MQYPENIFQTFIILILRLKECSAFSILMEEICVVSQQRTYNPQRWLEKEITRLSCAIVNYFFAQKKKQKKRQTSSLPHVSTRILAETFNKGTKCLE